MSCGWTFFCRSLPFLSLHFSFLVRLRVSVFLLFFDYLTKTFASSFRGATFTKNGIATNKKWCRPRQVLCMRYIEFVKMFQLHQSILLFSRAPTQRLETTQDNLSSIWGNYQFNFYWFINQCVRVMWKPKSLCLEQFFNRWFIVRFFLVWRRNLDCKQRQNWSPFSCNSWYKR